MSTSNRPLVQQFAAYFDILLVRTPNQFEQMYRIRGDVYGKEFGYEPEENCPGGLEYDDYDCDSIHCLIVHRSSHTPAGCVRLILMPPDSDGAFWLPATKYCNFARLDESVDPRVLRPDSMAEASRLAVHTLFRNRDKESLTKYGINGSVSFEEKESCVFPLLSTALFMASVSLCDIMGRTHGYVMIEPRLARLLKRAGLNLIQVGDLMDYHGERAAFYLSVTDAMRGIRTKDCLDMFNFVHQSLQADYESALTDPTGEFDERSEVYLHTQSAQSSLVSKHVSSAPRMAYWQDELTALHASGFCAAAW